MTLMTYCDFHILAIENLSKDIQLKQLDNKQMRHLFQIFHRFLLLFFNFRCEKIEQFSSFSFIIINKGTIYVSLLIGRENILSLIGRLHIKQCL